MSAPDTWTLSSDVIVHIKAGCHLMFLTHLLSAYRGRTTQVSMARKRLKCVTEEEKAKRLHEQQMDQEGFEVRVLAIKGMP